MPSIAEIAQIALREHEIESELPSDQMTYSSDIQAKLDAGSIPQYAAESRPLSLITFKCMLQDTGYPMEVYLPPNAGEDMSQLQERWIGWGVDYRLPGAQEWLAGPSTSRKELPDAVRTKYPLLDKQKDYLGAMIKVYEDVSYKPATLVEVVGIVSTTVLPAESEDLISIPTIHALRINPMPYPTGPSPASESRQTTIDYLASCFDPPDQFAAELILLNLISRPIARPVGQDPLGTLSLNLISPQSTQSSSHMLQAIQSLMPLVVPLPLSVSLLHNSTFVPKSVDSTSLDSGVLQLGQGTVLAVQEGEMGEGGQLNEKAIKNLQALIDCIRTQTLRYEYPYMDGLKMDCAIRAIIFSEGKSLVPVDLHIPLQGPTVEPKQPADLASLRSYLADRAQAATKVVIPDEIAQRIQDDFVASRQGSGRAAADVAGEQLKRRMKMVRLIAQSHLDPTVTVEHWQRAIELDEELERRMKERSK